MTYLEILARRDDPITLAKNRPHLTYVPLDPVLYEFVRAELDLMPGVDVLEVDPCSPYYWVLTLACETERLRDRIRQEFLR